MAFTEISLDELVNKIERKIDFILIVEETRDSILEITKTPDITVNYLLRKLSSIQPCSGDIVYFLNEDKITSKIALGLVTEDKPNLMYWKDGKPKFSFFLEDIIKKFK